MNTLKTSVLGILVLTVAVLAQQPSRFLLIERATIIDGTGRAAITDGAILIEGERIRDVGRRGDVRVPAGVTRLDARGKWIIPGLIDAHIHFGQSAGLYTRPDIIDLRQWRSYEQELAWIKQRLPDTLGRYVSSGVTGVVDVGGPMWNFEVRDIAARTKKAPRVAVAGPLISSWTPPAVDARDPDIIKANSAEHARELVRQQLPSKPDLIKIWWVRQPFDNLRQQSAVFKAAIDESHAAGVRVAVHATELETAKAALEIGADILVHSVSDLRVDNEFIRMMMARDILYITTLAVDEGYREVLTQRVEMSDIEQQLGDPEVIATWADLAKFPAGDIPGGIPQIPPAEKRPIAWDNLVLLEASGIRVVGATDAGNIGTLHGPAIHREFELMAEAGVRPTYILMSATRNAAAVMGRQTDLGTLERGKLADLVILNADPLADIRNTRKIHKVMKSGEFLVENESSPQR
jgi:imidazolonepropionase-like amidohydrolase